MHLETAKINELRSFIEWARNTTKKAANLEISFWNHRNIEDQKISYRIWIDSVFSKESSNLDFMVEIIPDIKRLCLIHNHKECVL